MTNVVVTLKHGLKLDEKAQLAAELQEPDAGHIIDSRLASERPVHGPLGTTLVPSPSIARRELLRRQIVRIGGIPANPLSEDLFRQLSGVDLALLERKAIEMDDAALAEVELRGRDHTPG